MLLGVLREGILEIVEDGGYASESEPVKESERVSPYQPPSVLQESVRILVQVAVYRFELGNIDAGNIAGRELPNVSYEELAELLGVTIATASVSCSGQRSLPRKLRRSRDEEARCHPSSRGLARPSRDDAESTYRQELAAGGAEEAMSRTGSLCPGVRQMVVNIAVV